MFCYFFVKGLMELKSFSFFDVLLTLNLSIILVTNQLDAQILVL